MYINTRKTKLTFLIQSNTVNIENYTIKDIPGSSGRLDVVARCILAAVMNDYGFDKNVQIIIFFKRYGGFKFNPNKLNFKSFPKDELQLSDALFHLIMNRHNENYLQNNPMGSIKQIKNSMIRYIKKTQQQKENIIFVLKETPKKLIDSIEKLRKLSKNRHLIFIVGNQSEDFINSEDFNNLNLQEISLGSQSYLASSVMRLVKLNLHHLKS
ncbi:MAG: hypothetical protein EU547_04765 [Promethearchaeota archaeon]|nr:MAG: hypothetical protein EU547_04765 [Candidatus Lokiarchaeota archaeon]